MKRFLETAENFDGIFSISKNIIGDHRGYLERLFCCNDLKSWENRPIQQVNRTFTQKKGTVRGLHFQRYPYAEAKLICCLQGKVIDYALDLRQNSTTFGEVFSITLDADLHNAILLPEGFAHGFQSLCDNVEMLYFHSSPYKSDFEAGVNIMDPELMIDLPLTCTNISNRDQNFPLFKQLKEHYL